MLITAGSGISRRSLERQQTLFAVVDYKADPVSLEFGIGHGFSAASDALVLKMILSCDF
jgi:hypothetical protein